MRGRAVRGECVAATTCMMTNLVGCTDTFPAVSVAHKLAATYTCVSPLFHPTLYHHCGCRLCPEDGVDQDRFSFLHTLLFTDVCHVMPLRGSGCSHFDGVWQFNYVCVWTCAGANLFASTVTCQRFVFFECCTVCVCTPSLRGSDL